MSGLDPLAALPNEASDPNNGNDVFRYTIPINVPDFEDVLTALAGGVGNKEYSFTRLMGHCGDDPLKAAVATFYRQGLPPAPTPDSSSFIELAIYQATTPEPVQTDQMVLLAKTDRLVNMRDLDSIRFKFESGSSAYLKPLVLKVTAGWDDQARSPAWKNQRELSVSLIFEGYRTWLTPEKPVVPPNFETGRTGR